MSPSRRATDSQFAGALQDRVRHARRLAALSQAALASRVGVGPSAVAQWELPGGTSPTVEHMTRIAQTCDVQFEWLATGRGEVRNGHEQVLGFHLPGEVIGLNAIHGDRYPCNAIALDTVMLCRFSFPKISVLATRLPGLRNDAPEGMKTMGTLQNNLQISALDLRLSIMAGVLVAMAVAFHIATGNFLTPENLYNIAQQSAVVGIVAAAIGLIIVARHIDLSVGSVLATTGVLIAYLMYGANWHWVPASLAGLLLSLAIATYQGWLVAYLGVPSFVVTLGGLMSFRGVAFLITDGRTQPVTDATFLLIGGGLDGALGPVWSWALGLALSALIAWNTFSRRRSATQHGFPLRPLWADMAMSGFFIAATLVFVALMCAYQLPSKQQAQGIPNPVIIWGAVVMFMAFIVKRTRFGRAPSSPRRFFLSASYSW